MIISHEHRYVFVEIPLTASYAIRYELCDSYGGEPILHKHASYPEFLSGASADEKRYLAFATVRNPLDEAVSRFFKLKTDHESGFSDPAALEEGRVDFVDVKRFRFIQDTAGDFETYFLHYHRRPFSSLIDLSGSHLDFVIRYEQLQQDFSAILAELDLDPVRAIPVVNKTGGRKADWMAYYTPATVELAKLKFQPFMRRWGYEFPVEWGPAPYRLQDEWTYRLLGMVRRQYFVRFRYHPGLPARAVRRLISALAD